MIEASGPRQSIWLLGILALLGNLAVIAWRLIRRDDHPVQTCLLTNLAVSDFFMGVYLMIIAIKDLQWAGNKYFIDHVTYSLTFYHSNRYTRPYRKSTSRKLTLHAPPMQAVGTLLAIRQIHGPS